MTSMLILTAGVVLVGLFPSPTFGGWSDWERVDSDRRVWLRIDTRPTSSGRSYIHYQFRNDSVNAVSLQCNFRSFEGGKPIDTVVQEQLAPGISDTQDRFVIGDGTLLTECAVK